MNYKNIIVALDGMTVSQALAIAQQLRGCVWGFKVNDLLFEDSRIIQKLKKYGNVFADAKLHDIPATVAHSTARLVKAGADMVTVHASGGKAMMRAAQQHAGRSRILGVTVLTSDKADHKKTKKLVRNALAVGLSGVVCSGHELAFVRRILLAHVAIAIIPGIRPAGYAQADDQRQVMTPLQALKAGADYIVIGRPIMRAKNPMEALKSLIGNAE